MISNCLIEALKAKIKDPKNVTIHSFPAKINGHGIFPHYWWSVGDQGFDFKRDRKTKQSILFKGSVRSYSKDTYEEYLADLYKKSIIKDFERKGLKNPFNDLIWHEGRPTGKEAKLFYISYYDNEGKAIVRLIHNRDLDHYAIESWRNGDDDETSSFVMNSNYSNEDGLGID